MKTKMFRAIIVTITLFLTASCGAIFTGTNQKVSINSVPAGARVTIDPTGQTAVTPATVKLSKKSFYHLTFQMEGYKDEKITIMNEMNIGILVLDLFAGLIGVVVDLETGGCYKLTPDNVTITLQKLDSAARELPDHIILNFSVKNISETENQLSINSEIPGVRIEVSPETIP